MVVVHKQNGSPRRTVDMQRLNDASLRQTHPVLLPYYESSKLTTFAIPFGLYRYLTNPQGNHVSGDAYNKWFDEVHRQVDDSLLWDSTVEACFRRTAEHLTLLGNDGILQNPAKFQFCKQEVDWSGFRITNDGVKPMAHISQSIRDFPTPVNRTDMRSFMALVNQVSYATAFAPARLLEFLELLRDKILWFWSREMDELF